MQPNTNSKVNYALEKVKINRFGLGRVSAWLLVI